MERPRPPASQRFGARLMLTDTDGNPMRPRDSPTVLRPSCAVGANVGHARRAQAAGGMVVVGDKVEAGGTVAVCTGATSFGMRIHKIG
jgi:hypothetical protein